MSAIIIDSKTATILKGNHIGDPRVSCKKIDSPTHERVTVILDGIEYERTVWERVVWRNRKPSTVVARFVWINGIFYAI